MNAFINSELRRKVAVIIEPSHSSTLPSRIYNYVMLTAIVVGIAPLLFRGQTRWMTIADWGSCICYIIDYILRWLTVDIRKNRPTSAFLYYPIMPMAIIDLLTIIPTFTIASNSLKVLRMTRLLKILRIVKAIRYFKPLQLLIAVVRQEGRTLLTVLVFAIFYIFVTALIMFNAEDTINPNTGLPLFDDFFDAFYWATCTLTTVGYGDLYPITDLGRAISMISAVVGVAIIALPSGIVTAGYMTALKEHTCPEEEASDESDASKGTASDSGTKQE